MSFLTFYTALYLEMCSAIIYCVFSIISYRSFVQKNRLHIMKTVRVFFIGFV